MQSSHDSNQVLASLSSADMATVQTHLRFVELPQETVLFEAGDSIGHVVFPHAGIVSLVVNLASGEMIEAAMIGREGVVGGLSALDTKVSVSRAVVQVAGAASTLDVEHVRHLAEHSASFRATLIRTSRSCRRSPSNPRPVSRCTPWRRASRAGCCAAET